MAKKLLLSEYLSAFVDPAHDLPIPPSLDQLALLRKGLRKKSIPNIFLLPDDFEYEGLGSFSRTVETPDVYFSWAIHGGEQKSAKFSALCLDPEREFDRLEFGWMIANFAKTDGRKHLQQMRPISYEDRHQNAFYKQYARQEKHFKNLENEWRHW
jgi:hypothetical protein